jgi:predicted ATP-binding protein involved in virulence
MKTHYSVILIDEIELHLHPPMQQTLLRALPKLGKNNQFIITWTLEVMRKRNSHLLSLLP